MHACSPNIGQYDKENGTCMYCGLLRYELQVVDIVSAGVTDKVTHQREAMSGT